MPPQFIIMGMPEPIMAHMRLQASMNMSFEASSIAVISQTMPSAVILQVVLHIIIGIMPIIGIIPGMPIMLLIIIGFIIGFIMGIPIIMGFIMPFIIGIDCIMGVCICFAGVMFRSIRMGRPPICRPSMGLSYPPGGPVSNADLIPACTFLCRREHSVRSNGDRPIEMK